MLVAVCVVLVVAFAIALAVDRSGQPERLRWRVVGSMHRDGVEAKVLDLPLHNYWDACQIATNLQRDAQPGYTFTVEENK